VRSRKWIPASALAIALWLGAAAGAQNLVVNGSFDSNVSGWSTVPNDPEIGIAWSPLDPDDPTASGSIEVTSTVDNGGVNGPSQCVDATSASPLRLSMEGLVPTQLIEYLYADPIVRYFDTPSCSGNQLSSEFPIGLVAMGEGWQQIGGPLVPPPATQSIRIVLGIGKPVFVAWPATVYYDEVYLPEPALLASTATALAGLASLARRRRAGPASQRRRRRLGRPQSPLRVGGSVAIVTPGARS
jgi:hypothetical protein